MLAKGIYCRGCGYDLRESDLRCPECGRLFNRGNPLTFDRVPRWLLIRRWIRRLLLLLLFVTLPPALGLGWLAWGWWQEQRDLAALCEAGWDFQLNGIGRPEPLYEWLPKWLPARWAYLADRAHYLLPAQTLTRPAQRDLDRIARLSGLRSLMLPPGTTDADVRCLRGLTRLESLTAFGGGITDEGLVHLSQMNRMESLRLYNASINGRGLRHLRHMNRLRELRLPGAPVTDEGVAHLVRLSKLAWLDLGGSRITDRGMSHLAGLTELHALSLLGTSITDDGLEYLKGLRRLSYLYLDDTRVTPAGEKRLRAILPPMPAHIHW